MEFDLSLRCRAPKVELNGSNDHHYLSIAFAPRDRRDIARQEKHSLHRLIYADSLRHIHRNRKDSQISPKAEPCRTCDTPRLPISIMVSSNRPRTPTSSASPPQLKLDAIPENNPNKHLGARRSSLGNILRRSKSSDLGHKGSKKQQAAVQEQEQMRRQREEAAATPPNPVAIPRNPPRLPLLYNGAAPPQLQTFGGEDRPDSVAIISGHTGGGSSNYQGRPSMAQSRTSATNVTMPASPTTATGARTSESVDPYARTESMTHRGRYSYASSAVSTIGINSPRRVRRRKDPTPFK